jgi:hypothetical protein
MIFFVPAYDECTRANLTIAQLITTNCYHCIQIFGVDATQDALFKELTKTNLPLFAMSHGNDSMLKAQDGQIALSNENIHKIGKRSVYAFACNTAIQLGKSAAEIGSTWWGYSCPISCAIDSPYVQSIFTDIFIFIRNNFHQATTPQQRQAVLDELKNRCEQAFHKGLSECYAGTLLAPTFQEYQTLLEIWGRLRIWVPGLAQPEKHPSASEAVVDWF